ncbi:50S ribosomal protein L7ae-like protein, partial [Salmonella enterica subsp. enterica serovar Typhi]|nr:50S ribosomal protein L7ae-like protein [Salmonella enterica subsp. enterica serovar Typhi]
MSNDKGLRDAPVKIGTKQTMRMVELGRAEEVYVAENADPRLTSRVVAL